MCRGIREPRSEVRVGERVDAHVAAVERRVPSRPRLLVATLVGGINVTVEWTEPQVDGGSPITSYVIKYGDSSTDVDKFATLSIDGDTTNFQFTDLNENTSYRFAVAAVNAHGQGRFSEFTHDVHTSSIGEE